MGVIITKQGIEENSFTWEYYCDTYEDMGSIAQENVTIGSYCTLLNGENGVEIYAGDGNHQWVLITPSIRDKYSADNDGKVILNGNALSQTNLTITENGTFNTTLNNSVEVLVEPSLQNKTVTTNGVVTHDNNYYGLDQVTVNVSNSYEDEDEGKVVQNGALVNQTSRIITENGTYNTTINNEVIIATENVYENSDEGKVVKNGELIEQTSYSIDENGTYDTTEYNEVVVDIENTINLQSKTTTVNGEILPDNGYDGLSQVTVAVEGGATLQTKTITENGTVEPDDGYDGFSEITVIVSNSYEEEDEGKVVSNGELISQTSTTITENGTYNTTTYNEVIVDGIEVEPLIIDSNDTYTAPAGKAYSPVTVSVPNQGSPLIVQPLKYLTNSHYYVGAGREYYYADPIETIASYELEVGAHYIVTLNGTPGPRFRRVMFDNEPFTVVPQNPPAPGSGQQVEIQSGTDVDSGYTENPPAYTNFTFEATKRYLGLHLSLNPGDTPTVYLFKIV